MNTILLMGDAVWISLISGIVSLISLLMTLLIKNGQEKLRTEIDGKMTQLLISKEAEGKEKGIEQARVNQVIKDDKKSKLTEDKEIRDSANKPTDKPQDVTIVQQKEEIPVIVKKP